MNGTIVMELKSDACVGTGESASGIVDIEIQYDKYGIPYIPVKRIKGILREEAMELTSLCKGFTESDVNSLFGASGASDSGPLWMGNGEIAGKDDFINRLLQKKEDLDKENDGYSKLVSPSIISEMFTDVRAQTAINQNGVADKDSLRISRVIRRGNVFRFPVRLKGEYSEKLFTDAVRCVRHIGSNRNRGLGWVSCKWEPGKDEAADTITEFPDVLPGSKAVVMKYKLELLTDCILDSQYIHGSTVLGMAASIFLQRHKTIKRANAHNDPIFRGLFLDDTVCFSDAHPCDGDGKVIPVPLSLANNKGKPETLYNRFKGTAPQIQYEKPNFAFCTINDDEITPIMPQTATRFHHKRASDMAVGSAKSTGNAGNAGNAGIADITSNDGEFYQYDCIAAGTRYAGEITGPEPYIERLKSLLTDNEVFIGKSRSAQYGHCRLTCEAPQSVLSSEESDEFENDEWPVLLLSNMLLYNETGQPDCTLEAFEKAVRAETGSSGISIIPDKSTISVDYTDGFNTQWRMPKPVEPCFVKGSVFALDVSGVDIKERKPLYSSIQTMRLGQYTSAGLGRICIAPIIDEEEFAFIAPDITSPDYKGTECLQFDEMWKESLLMQTNEAVKRKVLSVAESWRYCKIIRECLIKSSKSVVRFLMYTIRKATSFEEIESSLGKYADRQKERGDLAEDDKPYTNLVKAIKPDGSLNLCGVAGKQIGYWIDTQQDIAVKVWKTENIKESEPIAPEALLAIYKIILVQTCLSVLAERRGKR